MEYRTNAPEVKNIVKLTFPEYNGRDFIVSTFNGPMELRSYWDSGSRDFWSIINLSNNRSKMVPENGSPFIPKVWKLSKLPPNFALVRYHSGSYKYVTVYIGQENISKMLPAPKEITWQEKVVLSATRSLKSSYAGVSDYRFREASSETGISKQEWDQAKLNLVSKGMLNKAGAITNDGRNAIGNVQLRHLKDEKPS
jgi:uncharacterized protein YlbG (UPF0298 family)